MNNMGKEISTVGWLCEYNLCYNVFIEVKIKIK